MTTSQSNLAFQKVLRSCSSSIVFNAKTVKMQHKNDNIPIYKIPVAPDRELLLWEKWIQVRSDETTHLGKKLARPPVDLAMNLLDKVREDKEQKVVLEHAQIDKKTGVRGSLWDRPPRLKQPCYCNPVYELRRTPAELGRPKVIEHIGVPTYIQQTEMGMAGEPHRMPCLQLNADYEKYRNKREQELQEKIRKIDPFRPDIKGLIIKGSKPLTPPPKMPPVPDISIQDEIKYREEALSGVYAIKINNAVFLKEIPYQYLSNVPILQNETSHESCTSWTYYFNVPVKRAGRSKLFLQNLGTVTLRYCWKKIKRIIPFIPDDVYEQVFFFNKNEDVLSPGQSKYIYFTFISDKPGIYSEFWELSLSNICFFDTGAEKLTINLYADSVEDVNMIKRKVEVLKTRIHRKAIDNLASEFLNEILDNVFAVAPQTYPYKKFFLEAEMFVLRNPVCFYHQTEVAKMKELYTEMVPGDRWDLSIGTWRQIMMAKEYEDRMKFYELLRKSHTEFLKPWYEGEDLLKEKYRMMKYLLGQLADKFDKEYILLTQTYSRKQESTEGSLRSKSKTKGLVLDPRTAQMVNNVFFLRIYEHVATTIELCAGVLSSMDMNRWIEFDFCRH